MLLFNLSFVHVGPEFRITFLRLIADRKIRDVYMQTQYQLDLGTQL
jgi:hypothetical protein